MQKIIMVDRNQIWIKEEFSSYEKRIKSLELQVENFMQLLQSRVSGQSELSCGGNCGMNYCDTNGCIDRKRILTEPKPPEDSH